MSTFAEQVHALPFDEQLDTLEAIIGGMTVEMAVKLVPRLEEVWGVEAVPKMPDFIQGPQPDVEDEVEKSSFDVLVTEIGGKKIQVIKAVRVATALPLKEAKDLIDVLPAVIKKDLQKEDAETLRKTLEEAGAVVEIQ